MKRTISIFILILTFIVSNAKEKHFSFDYPDSLAENADAVILFNRTSYTRTSLSDLNEQVHFAITILGERGKDYREFLIRYDPFTSVKKISCTIYDRHGNKVRKLKNSDVKDYSDYSSYTFFHDNRVKYFEANHPEYPYTIELEYEIDHNGFIGLDSWFPVANYNVGVREAKLTVVFPNDLEIRYKERKAAAMEFSREEVNDKQVLNWSLQNAMPIEYERFAPSFSGQVPVVYLAPVQFKYDKSKGEFSSWEAMGEWNSGLLDDNFQLSEKTINDLEAIREKSIDRHDLVKNVYHYMQAKTRYVGIQLGIGGYRPMSPTLVDEVGYGDCKALSFYTKALLNSVGVKSDYAVIGVDGQRIQFDDFASVNQMNHVILCVPDKKDTIWLECTSQNAPFNHLFDGTTGRKALLINKGKGKIVKTPDAEIGCERQWAELFLDQTGKIKGSMKSSYSGAFYDDYYWLKTFSAKELSDYVQRTTVVNGLSVNSVQIEELEQTPEITLNREIKANGYSSVSGDLVLFELSPFSKIARVPVQRKARRNPIEIQSARVYSDSVIFHIPEGYAIEFQPEAIRFESKYGNYTMQISIDRQKVIYKRVFLLEKGRYEPTDYNDFVAFIDKVSDADHCKLVLKKL